ncbi:hypothetical protein NDU88_003492 [Pleurodeles waltl]|uniref:Uncharacterized protein n=1 Tax=Pleurodeles waltl TaxID=8319 RepID=A0AAV7MSL6_PLEWA|nr:hypothetical protein NDU88_003492 [Pleurodeles waltl]
MLTKPVRLADDGKFTTQWVVQSPELEDQEGPVRRSFLEALFTSIREDLEVVKKDLSPDLRDVRRNLEEIDNRALLWGTAKQAVVKRFNSYYKKSCI